MINKIGKITLYVNNQEEAKQFWIEKMGFVIKFEQMMGPSLKWLEVGPSEDEFTTFVLYDRNAMKQHNPSVSTENPSIILSTCNIKETYNKLVENGVKTEKLMEMPYGTMFTFFDMEDNSFLVREDQY